MDPLFLLKDRLSRAFERKWAPILLIFLLLCSTMCGILFVKTPVFYDYNLKLCDRFLDRVCYSDRNVFLIFLERTAGNALCLLLLLVGGLHPVCLPVPFVTVAFRAYSCGGMTAVLFSVYGVSGAVVALALYLPVRFFLDCVFLLAASCSVSRAFRFRFCAADMREALSDLLFFLALVVLVCLFEMILLLVFFHPIGNIL